MLSGKLTKILLYSPNSTIWLKSNKEKNAEGVLSIINPRVVLYTIHFDAMQMLQNMSGRARRFTASALANALNSATQLSRCTSSPFPLFAVAHDLRALSTRMTVRA